MSVRRVFKVLLVLAEHAVHKVYLALRARLDPLAVLH